MSFKQLATLIAQGSCFVRGINPRAVEFLCHYIMGSQKPMKLNKNEIAATKLQIIDAIKNGYINEDGTGWVSCPSGDWLTHTTKGIIGGYLFKVSQTDKGYIANCLDIWDFNGGQVSDILVVPDTIPSHLQKLGIKILEVLGVHIFDLEGDLCIAECSLAKYNEDHCFHTEWQVTIDQPLFCSIHHMDDLAERLASM